MHVTDGGKIGHATAFQDLPGSFSSRSRVAWCSSGCLKHVCALQTLERQAGSRRSLQWRPSRALGQGNRLQVYSLHSAIPEARGLYDPANDKDACGVGFIGRPCA